MSHNETNAQGKSLEELFQGMLPKGAKERSSDIVGTWDPERSGPIACIPQHATVQDGKKFDKTKPMCLIFVTLTKPCMVAVKGDEDDDDERPLKQANAGDMVGIWAKPGMRDIRMFCGAEVFLARDPSRDKDIGKGNDMKAFRVVSANDGGKLIPLSEDRRDKSKGTRCILDPAGYGKPGQQGGGGRKPSDDGDEIPF